MRKDRAKAAVSILIGIVVAIAAFEAAATAWLTVRDGKYTSASTLWSQRTNTFVHDVTRGSACRYGDILFPHPYLAFVLAKEGPCGIPYLNNIGLFGDDFPFARDDRHYTILLTGGSVASQLGQTAPRPAPRYLEEELNAHYMSPTGRPFRVLNGGNGAWKQPQQMILFSMYAETVDAVVTLDGYNEQHMIHPGVMARFELPGNNFLDANPVVAQDGFGRVVLSWSAGRAAALLQNRLPGSHGAYLIAEALSRLTTNTESVDAHAYWKMMLLPEEIYSDPEKLQARQTAAYLKYIRIMEATARQHGVKSMYFLQPVPAIGKVLSDEEKRTTPDVSYGARYVKLVGDLQELNGEGIAVRSLLDIYSDQTQTIYADAIHPYQDRHYASPGYRLMAARMSREMAEGWKFRLKQD